MFKNEKCVRNTKQKRHSINCQPPPKRTNPFKNTGGGRGSNTKFERDSMGQIFTPLNMAGVKAQEASGGRDRQWLSRSCTELRRAKLGTPAPAWLYQNHNAAVEGKHPPSVLTHTHL